MAESGSIIWTLQEFTQVAGKPWFALQEHTDAGVQRQFSGYKHELAALCRKLRISPERLAPTTEEEFIKRQVEEQGEGPRAEGRLR